MKFRNVVLSGSGTIDGVANEGAVPLRVRGR